MTNEQIFSGLKVVDLASFIAGPSAAVILSDFGAEVIKVEPPSGDLWRRGHLVPPQPQARDAYPWHLANRNKRGMTLDLKSPSSGQVLEKLVKWADVLIVNTPRPARKRLKLEYEDVMQWNPRLIYADITGFGDNGPDAELPGFDITSYWARSGLLSMTRDAGAPPTWPVAGSGDNATAVGLYSAIVTALYRRERTGNGSHVTTSLLAQGVWSASVSIQAALSGAKFYGLHDRKNPANAALNVYRAADDTWFVLIVTSDKLATLAKAIGRPDLLTDPRFSDPVKLMANMQQLTAILDEVFSAKPMAYWYEVLSGVHITFGAVRGPQEVIDDPQLRMNNIVVPLEGAGGNLTSTISSPIQVHGVSKVPAKRAPDLGQHNEEILQELGFSATEVADLSASGVMGKPTVQPDAAATKPDARPTAGSKPTPSGTAVSRLVILDLSGGRVFTVNPDGSDKRVIVTDCHWPDGVAVDAEAGHIYWTNMGVPNQNDGSIERANFDGQNRKKIVAEAQTFTPKQLCLDKKNQKLYWSDREGMRVMRSNSDGSQIETLVDSSLGDARPGRDARKWCVGIAVDTDHGQIYWTQKGADDANQGRIFRAGIEIPNGENAANRSDIEILFEGLPEPIDLELDLGNRLMYWTDRGEPPRGNTVNRASMNLDFKKLPIPDILLAHLMEGIGIALDVKGNRMFITDLAGTVYTSKLDGSGKKPVLVAQGNITGIAYVEIS